MKRLVVKPLDRLIDGVRTIAAGDYQLALPLEKRAEINIMAREIERRESDLKKLREMLRSIVDSMPSVLVGVDPEGRVTQWNREARKQTGIGASEALGRQVETVFPSLSGAMQKVKRAMQHKRVCKESKVARQVAGELRYADITIYPLMSGSTPFRAEGCGRRKFRARGDRR
jgi:PAS domain S-box-containing protein